MVVPATLVPRKNSDAIERACLELLVLSGLGTHMWCYHRLPYVRKAQTPVRERTSHRVRHFPRVAHSIRRSLLSPVCSSSTTSHRKKHRKNRFSPPPPRTPQQNPHLRRPFALPQQWNKKKKPTSTSRKKRKRTSKTNSKTTTTTTTRTTATMEMRTSSY